MNQIAMFAVLGVLCSACDTDWIDPLEKQPKYKPYVENILFPDGRSMRPLVETSVPRERALSPSAIREGLTTSAPVTRVPVPITRPLLERGRERYDIYCSPCHGILGDANSVVAGKMALRLPPSLVTDRVLDLSPGVVFRAITEGYGMMGSYAVQLPVTDRWAVVSYVEALQLAHNANLADAPAEIRQRLVAEPH